MGLALKAVRETERGRERAGLSILPFTAHKKRGEIKIQDKRIESAAYANRFCLAATMEQRNSVCGGGGGIGGYVGPKGPSH